MIESARELDAYKRISDWGFRIGGMGVEQCFDQSTFNELFQEYEHILGKRLRTDNLPTGSGKC